MHLLALVFVLSPCWASSPSALRAGPPPRTISLLGLFELTTNTGAARVDGRSELEAARMAVRHINQRTSLLPGFKLQLLTNDTKVQVVQVSWSPACANQQLLCVGGALLGMGWLKIAELAKCWIVSACEQPLLLEKRSRLREIIIRAIDAYMLLLWAKSTPIIFTKRLYDKRR